MLGPEGSKPIIYINDHGHEDRYIGHDEGPEERDLVETLIGSVHHIDHDECQDERNLL